MTDFEIIVIVLLVILCFDTLVGLAMGIILVPFILVGGIALGIFLICNGIIKLFKRIKDR